jgi:aminopeptidase
MYTPPKKILENYANVLVNFALNSGKGIKKGDVVLVNASEVTKPLYIEVTKAIQKAGGHIISRYSPDNTKDFKFDRFFYENATDDQVNFFPSKLYKGQVDEIDHSIYLHGVVDKNSLQGVDPQKMMKRGKAYKPYGEWRDKKENAGKFTWTICLYGTPAMAKEAKMTEKEYWNQIIKACFLDTKNPILEWRKVFKKIDEYRKKLNNLDIEKVHLEGKDVDLWVKIGEKKAWFGGSGRNIPSFEIFTSPDWRGTEGWIKFNQPLYRYGNIIKGIELKFKDGVVVESMAKENEAVLKAMIATENANKVGEFSMTDKRFSRISKFMGETLFDENIGGPFGNSHIALGNAYKDCYAGDPSKVKDAEWKRLGFNSSSVHTDIITTEDRTITAYLKNGKTKVIYRGGQFTL